MNELEINRPSFDTENDIKYEWQWFEEILENTFILTKKHYPECAAQPGWIKLEQSKKIKK